MISVDDAKVMTHTLLDDGKKVYPLLSKLAGQGIQFGKFRYKGVSILFHLFDNIHSFMLALDFGGDPNATDASGHTLLQRALSLDEKDIFLTLVRYGADLRHGNMENDSLLYSLVQERPTWIVELLACTRIPDKDVRTILESVPYSPSLRKNIVCLVREISDAHLSHFVKYLIVYGKVRLLRRMMQEGYIVKRLDPDLCWNHLVKCHVPRRAKSMFRLFFRISQIPGSFLATPDIPALVRLCIKECKLDLLKMLLSKYPDVYITEDMVSHFSP